MGKLWLVMRNLALVVAAVFLLTASLCQRTVIRDGIRIPAEEAQRMDLAEAEVALSQGRYDEAIVIYEDFHEQFPKSRYRDRALVRYGEALYKKGEVEEAELVFVMGLEEFPDSPEVVEAAWGLSLIAYSRRDCDLLQGLVIEHRDLAADSHWDRMTMLCAECWREAEDYEKTVRLYGDEFRQGKDQQLKERARTGAEVLIAEMEDYPLQLLAEDEKDGFPGDLALVELLRRRIDDDLDTRL